MFKISSAIGNFPRYMGLGMGKVYGTICGYYTQVKIYTQVKMNDHNRGDKE